MDLTNPLTLAAGAAILFIGAKTLWDFRRLGSRKEDREALLEKKLERLEAEARRPGRKPGMRPGPGDEDAAGAAGPEAAQPDPSASDGPEAADLDPEELKAALRPEDGWRVREEEDPVHAGIVHRTWSWTEGVPEETGFQKLVRTAFWISVAVVVATLGVEAVQLWDDPVPPGYDPLSRFNAQPHPRVAGAGYLVLAAVEVVLWFRVYRHRRSEARYVAGAVGAFLAVLWAVEAAVSGVGGPGTDLTLLVFAPAAAAHLLYAFFGRGRGRRL